MADAEAGGYAVGYFESWNLESLLAVAQAAEAARSPVILGFSGIYLTHPGRLWADGIPVYAAMGLEVCRKLSVPACLLFNESPQFDAVFEAVELGFGLVMFSDEKLTPAETIARVKAVCAKAHPAGAAVEAEMAVLPGMGEKGEGEKGDRRLLPERPSGCSAQKAPVPFFSQLTDAGAAGRFVAETGVDALAVNVGQIHLHGRRQVRLDLDRLTQLRACLRVPLVLHGATSVDRGDLAEAVRRGIRKINVGSILKQTWFRELCLACRQTAPEANPYEIIGSGLPQDVMAPARAAVQKLVVEFMGLFGSAGRSP
jgi:fructose/tagatose bisphosphate aldolase